MMTVFHKLITPTLLAILASILTAEEPKPETGWETDSGQITQGTKYVFGYVTLPPNFIRRMTSSSHDDNGDPFSGKESTLKQEADNLYPKIPMGQLPLCLPRHPDYRDISTILKQHGVIIKAPEWVLFSGGLAGNNRLYFCTNWKNADLIDQLFTPLRGGGPRSLFIRTTVVSIKNQGLKNVEWTAKRITQANPTIHARYGIISRSGEKSNLELSTPSSPAKGEVEYETTLGRYNHRFDCRLDLSVQLPGDNAIKILQKTAFPVNFANPFIIDCGFQGEKQRNYFLIVNSRIPSNENTSSGFTILKRLEQIEDNYALCTNDTNVKSYHSEEPVITRIYRSSPDLLEELRSHLYNPSQAPPAPIRVAPLPDSPHNKSTDRVFDITPQLKIIGLQFLSNEWIHVNTTRTQIIIHSSERQQESCLLTLDNLSPSDRIVRIKAQLASVDIKGLEMPDWTIQEIEKRKPLLLTSFSSVGRSGEKLLSGDATRHPSKDEETEEMVADKYYSLEVDPTIGESGEFIDVRISIHKENPSKDQPDIYIITAATLKDGEPTIVELGHPSSGTRTHLLILNADIITPDGSFYRNRLKPINP